MGEQIVEVIETENIYEGDSQAHFGPTTAAQGQTVTLTEAPDRRCRPDHEQRRHRELHRR